MSQTVSVTSTDKVANRTRSKALQLTIPRPLKGNKLFSKSEKKGRKKVVSTSESELDSQMASGGGKSVSFSDMDPSLLTKPFEPGSHELSSIDDTLSQDTTVLTSGGDRRSTCSGGEESVHLKGCDPHAEGSEDTILQLNNTDSLYNAASLSIPRESFVQDGGVINITTITPDKDDIDIDTGLMDLNIPAGGYEAIELNPSQAGSARELPPEDPGQEFIHKRDQLNGMLNELARLLPYDEEFTKSNFTIEGQGEPMQIFQLSAWKTLDENIPIDTMTTASELIGNISKFMNGFQSIGLKQLDDNKGRARIIKRELDFVLCSLNVLKAAIVDRLQQAASYCDLKSWVVAVINKALEVPMVRRGSELAQLCWKNRSVAAEPLGTDPGDYSTLHALMTNIDKVIEFERYGVETLADLRNIGEELQQAHKAHLDNCLAQSNYAGEGLLWANALFNHLMNQNQPLYAKRSREVEFYFHTDDDRIKELIGKLSSDEDLNFIKQGFSHDRGFMVISYSKVLELMNTTFEYVQAHMGRHEFGAAKRRLEDIQRQTAEIEARKASKAMGSRKTTSSEKPSGIKKNPGTMKEPTRKATESGSIVDDALHHIYGATSTAQESPKPAPTAQRERFRGIAHGDWRCSVCREINPKTSDICVHCKRQKLTSLPNEPDGLPRGRDVKPRSSSREGNPSRSGWGRRETGGTEVPRNQKSTNQPQLEPNRYDHVRHSTPKMDSPRSAREDRGGRPSGKETSKPRTSATGGVTFGTASAGPFDARINYRSGGKGTPTDRPTGPYDEFQHLELTSSNHTHSKTSHRSGRGGGGGGGDGGDDGDDDGGKDRGWYDSPTESDDEDEDTDSSFDDRLALHNIVSGEKKHADKRMDLDGLHRKVNLYILMLKEKRQEARRMLKDFELDKLGKSIVSGRLGYLDIQENQGITNITENEDSQIKRTISEIVRVKNYVDDFLMDPDSRHPALGQGVELLQAQREKLMKVSDLLEALSNGKEQSRRRLQSDQQAIARETLKSLTFSEVKPFDPHNGIYLLWIKTFMEDVKGMTNPELKLRKLKEGLAKDNEKTIILKQFQGGEFAEAIKELNSKFADVRLTWAGLAKYLDRCRAPAGGAAGLRELFLYSNFIRTSVEELPQLTRFMSEQWWMSAIWVRLPGSLQLKFCEDKAQYEDETNSWISEMNFYFDHWLNKQDRLLRKQHSLRVGAEVDILNNRGKKSKQVSNTSVTKPRFKKGFNKAGGDSSAWKPRKYVANQSKAANPKAKKLVTCKLCKDSRCDKKPCFLLKKARGNPDDKVRRDLLHKVLAIGLCPGCLRNLGNPASGHSCHVLKGTLQCTKPGCQYELVSKKKIGLNCTLCRCPRGKVSKPDRSKPKSKVPPKKVSNTKTQKRANITKVVKIMKTQHEAEQDEGFVNLCPEEFIKISRPNGKRAHVLVSYDTACDSELANIRTIKDLGHDKTVIDYQLVTANGVEDQSQPQASLKINKQGGQPISLKFTAVKSVQGGVLQKSSLTPVHPPLVLQGIVSKLDRRGSSPYHIILGTGSLGLHPDEVIWESEDGNSKVMRSKITGNPILMGKWAQKAETIFYSSDEEYEYEDLSVQLCYSGADHLDDHNPQTGGEEGPSQEVSRDHLNLLQEGPATSAEGEVKLSDMLNLDEPGCAGTANEVGNPYLVPGQTCRPPPPFGPANCNIGRTENYSTREMFPANGGLVFGTKALKYWYPRFSLGAGDPPVMGDNATCVLKREAAIPPILKKQVAVTNVEGTINKDFSFGTTYKPKVPPKEGTINKEVSFGTTYELEVPPKGKNHSTRLYQERKKNLFKYWKGMEGKSMEGRCKPGHLTKALETKKRNARVIKNAMYFKQQDFKSKSKREKRRKANEASCASTGFKLYQEKSSLAQLSLRDRLEYLKEDPLSLAEIPPALCNSCQNCTCNKNPQNFLKDELLKEALNERIQFNPDRGRWEVHHVPNDTMEKFPEGAGQQNSRARFRQVRDRALRETGRYEQLVDKFKQELQKGNVITAEQAALEFKGFADMKKNYMSVDYALKAEDKDNPGSRCKIRLVGDQSMSIKIGDERTCFNKALESGDCTLAKLGDVLNIVMNAPVICIGDIQSAFFSIDNHPELCSMSRFFFSTDPSPDGRVEEFVQRSVTMGCAMSTNVLASCIRKSLENKATRETDWPIWEENIYCDDVILHGVGVTVIDGELISPWQECLEKAIDLFRCLAAHNFLIPDFLLSGVGRVQFNQNSDRPTVKAEAKMLVDRIENWEKSIEIPWSSRPEIEGVDSTPREISVLGLGYSLMDDEVFIKTSFLANSKRNRGLRQGTKLAKGKVLAVLEQNPISRRQFAGLVGSTFDPLGWAAPVTLRWKLIQRRILTQLGKAGWPWGEQVPREFIPEIAQLIEDLLVVGEQRMKRYRGPEDLNGYDIALCSQGDAGDLLSATAQWVVFMPKTANKKTKNHVALMHARNKILGIHSAASVPSMELLSAQLCVKYTRTFGEFLKRLYRKDVEIIMTSDSTVVLALIRSMPHFYGFKPNYLRRVLELRASSDVGTWYHVPGVQHGVDFATKLHDNSTEVLLSAGWKEAFFLAQPRNTWPILPNDPSLSREPIEQILARNKELFADNIGQRGEKSGLALVKKKAGKEGSEQSNLAREGKTSITGKKVIEGQHGGLWPVPASKNPQKSKKGTAKSPREGKKAFLENPREGSRPQRKETAAVNKEPQGSASQLLVRPRTGERPKSTSEAEDDFLYECKHGWLNMLSSRPSKSTLNTNWCTRNQCYAEVKGMMNKFEGREEISPFRGLKLNNLAPTLKSMLKAEQCTRPPREVRCQATKLLLPPDIKTCAANQQNTGHREEEDSTSDVDHTSEDDSDMGEAYFDPPGVELKFASKFQDYEFLGKALCKTSRFDLMLNGLARAVCRFLRNSKNPKWKDAEANMFTIKSQIFTKMVQCLAKPTKDFVNKSWNLRARVVEHEKVFYTMPRLTEGQDHSNERIIILNGSALATALLRTFHMKNHGKSAMVVNSQYSLVYSTSGSLRYLAYLKRKCPTCQKLNPPKLQTPFGPIIKESLGKADFQMPWSHVATDYWGPITLRNKRGPQTYQAWGVVMLDYFSRAAECYLVSNYSTNGFRNVILQHGSRKGFPKKLFMDAGTQLQKFAEAVGSRKKEVIKGRLQIDCKPSLEVKDKDVSDLSSAFDMPLQEKAVRFGKHNMGWDDQLLNESRAIAQLYDIEIVTASPMRHSENPQAELTVKLIKKELSALLLEKGKGTSKLLTFEEAEVLISEAVFRSNNRCFTLGIQGQYLEPLTPAHFSQTNLFSDDWEYQKLMRSRVINQDYKGMIDVIRKRTWELHQRMELLFTKHLLALRDKWNEVRLDGLHEPGDVVFLLDKPRRFLMQPKLGIVHTVFQSKDDEERHVLVQVSLRKPKGDAKDPPFRQAFLSRAVSSLSAPVVKQEDRLRLGSSFYDLTDFYVRFGEFLEKSDEQQREAFKEEDLYAHHPNTEPFPEPGVIKPPEEDWVPFDPTLPLGGKLSAEQLGAAHQSSHQPIAGPASEKEHSVAPDSDIEDILDDDQFEGRVTRATSKVAALDESERDDEPVSTNRAKVSGRPRPPKPEGRDKKTDHVKVKPLRDPLERREKIKKLSPGEKQFLTPGCHTGLAPRLFPSYKGKRLMQKFYPGKDDILEFRINDEPYFTKCKVVTVLTRFFKTGYYVNIKFLEGKTSNKKADASVLCTPGEDNWSTWLVKPRNQPPRPRTSADADVELNPGPWMKTILVLSLCILMDARPRPPTLSREKITNNRSVELHRLKRGLVDLQNTNNIYFQGNTEFNLVKYSSETVTTNNYHGNYQEQSIGAVGTLNQGVNNPSLEESLKLHKQSCELYAGSVCVLTRAEGTTPLTSDQVTALTEKGGTLEGTGAVRGTFNDGDNGTLGMFHTPWSPPPPVPVEYMDLETEMETWKEEIHDKEEALEVSTCSNSVNIANNFKRVHEYLNEYSQQLKIFAGSQLAPHGFLPAFNSEDEWTRRAVFKIGDVVWSMWSENDTLENFSLKPIDDWTYSSISQACKWRGGNLVEIRHMREHAAVRELCQESNLDCGMLLLETRVQGRQLFWASGKPVMLEIPEGFSTKYFPPDDINKQAAWNRDPYIIMTFSLDGSKEYFLGYGGKDDTRFPSPDDVRSLCVMPPEHSQSVAMSLALQYRDDIILKTLLDLEDYKRKYENIQESIEQFNDLDGAEETIEETEDRLALGDESEEVADRKRRQVSAEAKCTEPEVALISGMDYMTSIHQQLRLEPSDLQKLVQETQVYFSQKSRDFMNNHQAEIRDEEAKAAKSLRKIKKLIPIFLDICQNWYGVIDKAFSEFPKSTNDIRLTSDSIFDMFTNGVELETLISTSTTLTLSFIFNVFLIAYMTKRKAQQDKVGSRNIDDPDIELGSLTRGEGPSAPSLTSSMKSLGKSGPSYQPVPTLKRSHSPAHSEPWGRNKQYY